MSRITRKELKSDKFALEVGNTVSFFEEHQKEFLRYGAIAIAAAVLFSAFLVYRSHQRTGRQEVLGRAIQIQEAPVGPPNPNGSMTFPTQEAKDEASTKAFSTLVAQHSGTAEAEIAQYYLGSILADQGKLPEAEKNFQEVAQKGDADYASLAKLSLAQLYFANGRDSQGEEILRDLMAHPTLFVSKEQATVTLARSLLIKKPAEARKLLDPLKTQGGPVGQLVLTLWGQLPPQ